MAWTGKLAAAMPLKGVEITWAHAPEEIRVLTSPDGSNFEEAICFRPTGKVSCVSFRLASEERGFRLCSGCVRFFEF